MTNQMQLIEVLEERPVIDLAKMERCLMSANVAIDIETQTKWLGIGPEKDFGLSYVTDVTVIAVAWGKDETMAFAARPDGTWEDEVKNFLVALFAAPELAATDRQHTLIAHNAVFDMRGLSKLTDGQTPDEIWDTMVMARLLHPTINGSYSLIGVAEMLKLPIPDHQAAMKAKRGKLHTMPLDDVCRYAEADALLSLEIYEKQIAMVNSELLWSLADWECQAVREYCRMAAKGIRLNMPFVRQRIIELSEQCRELSQVLQIDGLTMPGSPKSRISYIYQKKGVPIPAYEKDSTLFTDGCHRRFAKLDDNAAPQVELSDLAGSTDAIAMLTADGQYPELKKLAEYMIADRLLATLKALLDHSAIDGRLHSLVTIDTNTARRASSHPQMQNWNMLDMAGVVVGDDGFTLVEIDYSNAENWLSALLSKDNVLAAACAAEDFHSAMAAQYFGDSWNKADKDERKRLRKMSKTITFGTAYGMGAKKLARSLSIPYSEAIKLLDQKDRTFFKVKEAKDAAVLAVNTKGYVTFWTKRTVPVELSKAFKSWNFCCQGGVGEMIKRSIVLISKAYDEKNMRSRIALDMHDALILEVAHEEWDQALQIASQIMETIIPAKMNARTAPPIQWIAKPDLAENAKKWGKFQWHPEPPAAPAKTIDWAHTAMNMALEGNDPEAALHEVEHATGLVATADQRALFMQAWAESVTIEAEMAIPDLEAEDFAICFHDMDFRYEFHGVRQGARPSELTDHEKLELKACADALWGAIEKEVLSRTFHVIAPQIVPSVEVKAQQVEVNLENYTNTPGVWLQTQKQFPGIDLLALTGYSAEQLKREYVLRKTYWDVLRKRQMWCWQVWVACGQVEVDEHGERWIYA